ncbi:hypothetical protein, partial [Prevotella sp. P4-67]|uniref:hypothetical protein n=1 Tax=Prevotella sp. P4-67 TaxID=2024227 RepID=UPI001C1F9DB3
FHTNFPWKLPIFFIIGINEIRERKYKAEENRPMEKFGIGATLLNGIQRPTKKIRNLRNFICYVVLSIVNK